MSTNLIDEMTEQEAKALLNDICSEFGFGGKARTHSIIMTNIENSKRRSRCLDLIENYLSDTVIDDDGEPYEESRLNWGQEPDAYLETFKKELSYPVESSTAVGQFLELAKEMESQYPFLYVEIARTRTTDWMAWLCTHNKDTNPDRRVLVSASGTTPEEACFQAISELQR